MVRQITVLLPANKVYFLSPFHKGYCLSVYFPPKIQLFLFLLHSGSQGPLIKGERREIEEKEEKKEEEMHCLKYFPLKLLDEM